MKAASRRAGRGLSGDLTLLDEVREHQRWDTWAAITKTTMAKPPPNQAYAASNAGDRNSVVLAYLRKMAHTALGDPDGFAGDTGWETTAAATIRWASSNGPPAPGCDIWDRRGWAQATRRWGTPSPNVPSRRRPQRTRRTCSRTEVYCANGSISGRVTG